MHLHIHKNKISHRPLINFKVYSLALASVFVINNQEAKPQNPTKAVEYMGNPFVQPLNPRNGKNWYGSGDVNNDIVVNQEDVFRLEQVINGNLADPSDVRLRDRADVNGSGSPDPEDIIILQEYVNGTRAHLPAYLNELLTQEERRDWFRKIAVIANLSETCKDEEKYPDYICDCNQFSENGLIKFNYYDDATLEKFRETYPGYDFDEHNRFNWPLYAEEEIIYASDGTQAGHEMLVFNSGDNALEYDNLEHFEPQHDNPDVQIGQYYLGIGKDNLIYLRNSPIIEESIPNQTPLGYYFEYWIKNKTPENLTYLYHKYPNNPAVYPSITSRDYTSPNISVTSPTNGQISNDPKLVATITDATIFDRYKMVNGQKVYYNQNNSYSMDGVKSNEQMFNYTNKSLEGLSEGEHTLTVNSIDEFDNQTTTASINFIVDRTAPQFYSISPVDDSTYFGSTEEDRKVDFIYSADEPHLDLSKSYYKFNGEQNYLLKATDTLPLISREGMNKLEVYLADKAENATSITVDYRYNVLDALDYEISKNKINKPCQNPVKDHIRIEIENHKSDAEFEIYDVGGRLVGKTNINEEVLDFNIHKLTPGIYIFRINENGRIIANGIFIKE